MNSSFGQYIDVKSLFKAVEYAYRHGGLKQALECVQNSIDEWKEVSLNIGVTGRAGVGKSTFINTIRGLSDECPGAAPTGATETTLDAKAYPHPDNEKIVYWDLPGLGTLNFSRDTYFSDKRVQFESYDMFLILSCGRFSEEDLLLAEKVQKMNKLFIFIRTKVDNDVENEKKSKPNKYKKPKATEVLLGTIRMKVIEGLREIKDKEILDALKGNANEILFLVNGQDRTWTDYDFEKLIKKLTHGLVGLKRKAFILSMNILQKNVLNQKIDVLRGQMWKVCLLSALGSTVPIPGVAFAVDEAVIFTEASNYAKQLGVLEEDIEKAASICKKDVNGFKADVGLQVAYLTQRNVSELIVESDKRKGALSYLKYIPIFGTTIGSKVSYEYTGAILDKILNSIASDAEKLHEHMFVHALCS